VWKVERGFQDRLPIPLSLSEVVGLLMTRDLLGIPGANPFAPSIVSVVQKIRSLLTPRALELVDRMRAVVGVHSPAAKLQQRAHDHVPAIQSALAARRSLWIRYYSMSRDAESERQVDPYHLTYFNGGLYLVGYCHQRRAVRIFAVERIRALETLDGTFTIPADFDARDYLKNSWGLIRGDLVTVTAVFSKLVAPYVRERLWHPSQEIRELPGGRLQLTLKIADTLEVRRWLRGFGADAEVLTPPALREALRREAEKLATLLTPARKPSARVGASAKRPRAAAAAR